MPQGIGSPGNENGNHFAAIRKYEGEIPYQNALKEIWKTRSGSSPQAWPPRATASRRVTANGG
jgi:hypothetical protein